jgi:hypothetical protein
MHPDIELVTKDFKWESEIMASLAHDYNAFDVWRTGHWILVATDLHRILLRRNQIIGDYLWKLRDLWAKTEAPLDLAPLELPDEEQSFLKAIRLMKENAGPQAYELLQRLRATNIWWRTKNLQLMLSHAKEQPSDALIDARLAFQRVTVYDMASLVPGALAGLHHFKKGSLKGGPADDDLAKDFDAPEVFLNEKREEELSSSFAIHAKSIVDKASVRRTLTLDLNGSTEDRGGPMHGPTRSREPLEESLSFQRPLDIDAGTEHREGIVDEAAASRKAFEESIPVRRTPHMDVSTDVPIQPGTEFQVYVYADQEQARPGERVEDIVIIAPPEIVEFYLDVWLIASDHFELVQKSLNKLRILREEVSSNRLGFTLRTKTVDELNALRDELPALHKGSITACFSYDGKPCGRVGRVIDLAIEAPADLRLAKGKANRAMVPEPSHSIEIRVDDKKSDMLVQITQDEEINDGRHFHCLVETCLEKTASKWITPEPTAEMVTNFMSNFTAKKKSPQQLTAALKGAGLEMFESSPKNFQEAFWRLIDSNKAPETIQIITDEPHFLWELMVPIRGSDQRSRRSPLGVEFTIARWVTGNATTPSQQIPITESYVVAPAYPGTKKLENAEAECKMICDKFHGEQIQPATFDSIINRLQAKGVSLLHFACHGKAVGNSEMVIKLDEDTELTCIELCGSDVFVSYFGSKRPLVFLNACELGRQQAALTGAGGFPAAMIGLGARAVIAPVWSVKDTIAHEIATRFYNELEANPGKPFAAIFQEIRKKAYDQGEDTYAAYCFYGSPLATFVT